MKSKLFSKVVLAGAVAAVSFGSQAAVEVYNNDDTTVSLDASFNAFYANTSTDTVSGNLSSSRDQARIRSGFLPNWFGTTFSKKMGDVTLGGRASFWVSTNDSDETPTDGLIDTRQFYGTVDASWGQLLVGKDFTLYNRSNIFGDEILLGYGMTNDTLGLVDGAYVSFGNIGSGYIYPLPSNQITYRSPDMGGFKLAVGLIDPSRTATAAGDCTDLNVPCAQESAPRIEGELTYGVALGDSGNLNVWGGFMSQTSESVDNATGNDVDSQGVSYGAKLKLGGLSLHLSGYDGEGVGFLTGPADAQGLGLGALISNANGDVDSTGALAQASYTLGNTRAVFSYGVSEVDVTGEAAGEWENENTTVGLFHSFYPNLIGVVEYSMTEFTIGGSNAYSDEADTLAIGVIVNF